MNANEAPADREELLDQFRRRFDLQDFPLEDLNLAFTHSSYAYENALEANNERLEFLGDAVLSAAVSHYLYESSSQADEGELSKQRSRLVSRNVLGARAREMGFGPLMLLGRGEQRTGGARRRSVLGSALEALIGAVYLVWGFDRTAAFVRRHVTDPLMEDIGREEMLGDYKSALQEWTQAQYGTVPKYRRIGDSGPDHAKAFRVAVEIEGRPVAEGEGPRIKTAENKAARAALRKLKQKQD